MNTEQCLCSGEIQDFSGVNCGNMSVSIPSSIEVKDGKYYDNTICKGIVLDTKKNHDNSIWIKYKIVSNNKFANGQVRKVTVYPK